MEHHFFYWQQTLAANDIIIAKWQHSNRDHFCSVSATRKTRRLMLLHKKNVQRKNPLNGKFHMFTFIASYLHRRNWSDSPNYVKQVPALKRYFDMVGLFEHVKIIYAANSNLPKWARPPDLKADPSPVGVRHQGWLFPGDSPGSRFNYFGISLGRRLSELQNNLYAAFSLNGPPPNPKPPRPRSPSPLRHQYGFPPKSAEEAGGGARFGVCVCAVKGGCV